MEETSTSQRRSDELGSPRGWDGRRAGGPTLVAAIAAVMLLFRLITSHVYGLFVDELYFLACGEHLAWGYVDMPPLTAVQAFLARALFGDSMLAIRLLPALEGSALVLLVGALARRLGGGRWAQGIAALAAALAPGMLLVYGFLSMNAVEPLVWTGMAYALVRVAQGDPRWWVMFGVIAGIGLENKDTVLVYGFALVVGLVLLPERRLMANRWFLLGGLVALALWLPNLVWMVQHHFPHLEQLANIRRNGRNVDLSPLAFIGQQVLFTGPVTAVLCVSGLAWLAAGTEGRRYRPLAAAYLVALATLIATHGRVYYLLAAYPALLAAGGVALEVWLSRPRWSWAKPAYAALVAVSGAVLAPIATPILPPETYLRYTRAIHFDQPRIEHRATSALPQLFADRFGWPEMAETVARVYNALPPADRAKAAIFGQDYGQAGAVDFYGPKLGLPKAISGHLTYWYWGPRGYTGEVAIVLGDTREALARLFESVEEAALVSHPYSMRSQNFTIYVCRRPKGWTFKEVWPRLKNWG
ncbi:MAG: glycosyltransferase family 39 protein [Acidobacteriia bacterium]|nr:glycosyltransferase family 39 protein [Terriglobia bacterium]